MHRQSSQHKEHAADDRVWLLAIAAPRELDAATRALCSSAAQSTNPKLWTIVPTDSGIDLVWTGVGKSNAAGAIGRVLDPSIHRGVLSVGIGGALPGSVCEIGDVVCASESVFADEGVESPSGFVSCAQMGFAPFDDGRDSMVYEPELVDWLGGYADHIGPVACVSSCSGTDRAARAVFERTGAIVEAMEGASVALSANRIDPRLLIGELRVISNTTGDRDAQQWDLDGALSTLGEVLGRIANDLE